MRSLRTEGFEREAGLSIGSWGLQEWEWSH